MKLIVKTRILFGALIASSLCFGNEAAQDASKAVATAALTYGLTNKRTLENQQAFDAACHAAQGNLNTLITIDYPGMDTDEATITPLMAAAYSLSYYMILKLIMEGADPTIQGSNGYNAYDWVESRSWIKEWFPRFQRELDAALSFKPTTADEKQFARLLIAIYQHLEPLLYQRARGFYDEKQQPDHAGIVQFMRSYKTHQVLLRKTSALLLRTQEPDPDYPGLIQAAEQILRDVQTLPQPRKHHH